MISLVTAGRGDVRPRLQLWLFGALSSDVEVGDNNNNNDDDDDDDDDDEDDGVYVHFCQQYNMTGRQSSFTAAKLLLAVFVILVSVLSPCNAKISDKRLCYDKACSVVISKGKTVIPYNSKDHDILSFPINTDVNIFSKQAGNRPDLWGVEIEGKRGYAPSQFIRELKILHAKLEYTVPTEEFYHKQVNNVVEKIEKMDNTDHENIPSKKKDDDKIVISKPALKNSVNEAIVPHHVSPSYDSVYDGTLLPRENEEEPPPPSYATQTLQNYIKVDEQVQLNVYPNLASLVFSTFTDIWSDTEENSEEGNTEDDLLDDVENDEVNETVLEIEKTDASSLKTNEKEDEISENVALDYIIEGVSKNEILPQEVNDIVDNDETETLFANDANKTYSLIQSAVNENDSLNQHNVNESDSVIQSEENETNSLVQHKANETDSLIQSDEDTTNSFVQQEANETDSLIQSIVSETELLIQSEKDRINSFAQQKANKTDSLIKSIINETDSLIQSAVNETDSLIEHKVNESDSVIQSEENKTNSLVQHKANEIDSLIQSDEGTTNSFVQQEANETDSLIQSIVNKTELLIQSEKGKINSFAQQKANETDSLIKSIINETDSLIQSAVNETDSLIQHKVNESDSVIQSKENETNSFAQQKANETDSLIQSIINETDSLIQSIVNETDSLIQHKINETNSFIQHKENETYSVIQPKLIEAINDNEISEKEDIIEDTEQMENQEVNINIENKLEDNINIIDSVNTEMIVTQSSSSKNISTNESFVVEVKSVFEDLQDDIVPKQTETAAVTNHSIIIKNRTSAIVHDEKLDELDEQKAVSANSIDSVSVVNSTISEVPLKQDVDEKSVTSSDKVSLPSEESFKTTFLGNEDKKEKDSTEIGDNLTTNDSLVEELNLVDNLLNSEKQLEDNGIIIESNSNVIDNSSYAMNELINLHNNSAVENMESSFQLEDSNYKHIVDIPSTSSFGEFLGNRNLLNAKQESEEVQFDRSSIDENAETTTSSERDENLSSEVKQEEANVSFEEKPPTNSIEKIVLPPDTCDKNYDCSNYPTEHYYSANENAVTSARKIVDNSVTILYVCITAVTTLLFSLGYYFIENKRRDAYLIAKINNLEKDLMITKKECIMLDENFRSTKAKLDSIEDQSFGSDEMVLSLKTELAASENTRAELEGQIASLEKELESASEAGLELECMLREILSSHNEENNPLAQSIENLQDRLNDQQVANESLTNTLATKIQENETLSEDLKLSSKKLDESLAEVTKLTNELKTQISIRINLEQTLSDQVQKLEFQIETLSEDKSHLRKQLRMKELEVKELMEVVEQINTNNLDFEKLCEVSRIKAKTAHLLEERDELKIKLSEEEGAHQLLEAHIKIITEEVTFLSEQCKVAEKEKKDAETRLEVLAKFFEEKETQRQKEEAIWLEKQGEVSSTVDRLQTMQNEILNYKQQIEMLKREIVDQEREYKNQISALETKAHEQWVAARQNERRLEEVKAESSQLRNRLTLVEKNINDGDPEVKLHRLHAANGEAHQLFATPETSSSPLMFGASGPVPPPPPPGSFMYGPTSFAPPPPFLPPPPLAGSRPPPLGGGRLSSPPPGNGSSANNSSNNAGSEAGGLHLSSPPPLIPFPHHPLHRHRSPPPLPPFASDVPPPPPPPPSGSLLHSHHHLHRLLPPPFPSPLHPHQQEQQQYHAWGDEAPMPMRNSSSFHPHQRDQRAGRNHKGSLRSSGESLDKSHHGGKV